MAVSAEVAAVTAVASVAGGTARSAAVCGFCSVMLIWENPLKSGRFLHPGSSDVALTVC